MGKHIFIEEYRHICDSCGAIFTDNKEDTEHYLNNNGLIFCKDCKELGEIIS